MSSAIRRGSLIPTACLWKADRERTIALFGVPDAHNPETGVMIWYMTDAEQRAARDNNIPMRTIYNPLPRVKAAS